jgi:hypothetical protein
MKTRRLIIIGFIILVSLGRIMPMSLFPEPWHPWYMDYTTWWFIAAGFIFLPSALVSEALGLFQFGIKAYLIMDAIWLIALCLIIYNIPFRKDRMEEG